MSMQSMCGASGPYGHICNLIIGHAGRHEAGAGKKLYEAWRETVLQEAQRLVYGDRGETYGEPLDDFTRTAQLWSVVLDTTVDAEDVALCMILLKLSRELYQPKRDNRVDIAGYAECLNRVTEERERRGKDYDPMVGMPCQGEDNAA